MLAAALALAATVTWGAGDFLGGLMTRRVPLPAVVAISHTGGLAFIGLAVAIAGGAMPDAEFALYGALAGTAGVIGVAAFYRALAIGKMSVVAPISAGAAIVPVVVGVATGDRPSGLQAAGAALALAGVVVSSREAPEEAEGTRRVTTGAGLAGISALGFGFFFLAIDKASDYDVLWANFASRATSLSWALIAVLILRPSFRSISRRDLPVLVTVGVLDMLANVFFAYAATRGLISLVSILSSLYPLMTIFLAWLFLHERLQPAQKAGVAAALGGVALIAGG